MVRKFVPLPANQYSHVEILMSDMMALEGGALGGDEVMMAEPSKTVINALVKEAPEN